MTPARALLLLVSVMGSMVAAASPLLASSEHFDQPAVVTRGNGPTVVLLSGLLGGTARLEPLAEQLITSGFRVVAVDPYRLAADAQDVSFDGLARTVAVALHREGVRSAIVVAHAHASGIALRLSANFPELATNLLLLDAGVIASTRSAGVSRAMRLASFISRLPGGPSFIRSRLASGIRENSGDARWLSDAIVREYSDPMIEELPAVARMAARLAEAEEPETLDQMLSRVRTDVIALIGGAPHGFAPGADELLLLQRIPGARVRHVHGVGHFVHEEAAQTIVAEVLSLQPRRSRSR